MYSRYLGTSGHRASASVGFMPYSSYATPAYGHPGVFQHTMPPPPPHYMAPPVYAAPYACDPQAQYAPANASANQNANANANGNAAAGGISAVLDYEPTSMASFICWCAFGMLGQNRKPTPALEASIVSILHATRLPKSTIVIALEYMNQRFSNAPYASLPESEIFVTMVVALVLANKFNDDNTFTNKSWSGASGVSINVLNVREREWLEAVNWNLNVVNFRTNIETLEECWTSWTQKHMSSPSPSWNSTFQAPSPVAPVHNYGMYSPAPSSPVYAGNGSAAYGYSSPINTSPIRFAQDWSAPAAQNFQYYPRSSPYVAGAQQQSIWAYPPASGFQPGPPRMDSAYGGFAHPYYSSLATY